jgi:putative transposase
MYAGRCASAMRSSTSGKKYGNLSMTDLRELRVLRDENSKLEPLVADLSLDKHILDEIVGK